MNKKHFICAILLIWSLFLIGCDETTYRPWDSEETRKAKKLKKEQEEKEFRDRIISFISPSREIIVLLSYKYSISEETVQQLLKDYVKETDVIMKLLAPQEEKSNSDFKGFIDKFSTQHNIPKEKLASIIFDYKLYESIEGSAGMENYIEDYADMGNYYEDYR